MDKPATQAEREIRARARRTKLKLIFLPLPSLPLCAAAAFVYRTRKVHRDKLNVVESLQYIKWNCIRISSRCVCIAVHNSTFSSAVFQRLHECGVLLSFFPVVFLRLSPYECKMCTCYTKLKGMKKKLFIFHIEFDFLRRFFPHQFLALLHNTHLDGARTNIVAFHSARKKAKKIAKVIGGLAMLNTLKKSVANRQTQFVCIRGEHESFFYLPSWIELKN